MKRAPILILLAMVSCTVSHRLQRHDMSASLNQLSRKERLLKDNEKLPVMKLEYRGDSVYLVETEKVDGEDIMTLKAETVNVVANVRNVPERNGMVHISFRIAVPSAMHGDHRTITLFPTLRFTGDSIVLDPICFRGTTIDLLQRRESWQFSTYLERFKADTSAAYRRFVRFPIPVGARVDSVTSRRQETVYIYTQSLPSTRVPKRMELTLPGRVMAIDGSVYDIPERDTISYVISSMTTFIDTTTRHRIRIVDRNVSLIEKYRVTFAQGSAVPEDRTELDSIRSLQKRLREMPDLETDSILISAASSPEGSYRSNAILSQKRAKAVADSVFDTFTVRSASVAENWKDLTDSVKRMRNSDPILRLLSSEPDPDRREAALRRSFPKEYEHLRRNVYPALRLVTVQCFMHRRGMVKDTIHLQEIDTAYMNAVEDLRCRRYAKALETLSSYSDRNTAIAMMSLGYDRPAAEIISREPLSDTREYLLAILCSRLGLIPEGRAHYVESVRLNSAMEFRGNLDPEINKLMQ